jgi:putative redox protein
MKLTTRWIEKMQFAGESASGQAVMMDSMSPLGNDKGLTPKQLVALGISGCTAMDVAALMKKHKQPLEKFFIDADVQMTEKTVPIVFKHVHLDFKFYGALDREKVIEAVRLSQTKYCGVTAMLFKSTPMDYSVYLNDELVAQGEPHFE